MKIRAIELTNVRRFAGQSARIDGIGDGITVLSEPNEFGKSTIFDALHALFFEKHRGTRAPVKSLQPHSGGAPEVALELELPEGHFRIEKRWLSRATARISQGGRVLAQDDEAEAWVERLLGTGLAGPSGLLWVRQGLLGMEPEGNTASDKGERERALTARRDLLSSVAGEIDMMTGGRRLDAVVSRVEMALSRLATATQKPKAGGEWARAESEANALRTTELELSAKAARLSGDLARRADVQRELRDVNDPEQALRREQALEHARHAHAEANAHAIELSEARKAVKLAVATEENARAAVEWLEQLSERVAAADASLDHARAAAVRAEERAAQLAEVRSAAAAALAFAENRTHELRISLTAAQRAKLAEAARARVSQITHTLGRAEALRKTFETEQAQRAIYVVTPQSLTLAEAAQAEYDRASAQVHAQATSISLHYSGEVRVQEGGSDLAAGTYHLTAKRTLDLPGIGTLIVDPGAGKSNEADNLTKAARTLERALQGCGAETLADARKKLHAAQMLDGSLKTTDALLAELVPDGMDALRRELAQAAAEATAGDLSGGNPAELEAALANAVTEEFAKRDTAAEAQSAYGVAAEARAGARAALTAAEQTAAAARADAGDMAGLADRLHVLRRERDAYAARTAETKAVNAKLEQQAPDLGMVQAQLTRAESVVKQAQDTRDRLSVELATLNGSIGSLAELGIEEELDEVRGKLLLAVNRASRYAAEVQSLVRLRTALEDARIAARDAYFAPVMRELEPLLTILHPGATLQIDDQSLLPIALTRNGQDEPLEILSGGTREQLAILTRLAFARLFARKGLSVPVILDDALVHSDDDRIETMFTTLHRVAADQQILVLTCRQRAFAALGGERGTVVIRPA
ncbi:AAA family ATPase [Falsirhodobacter sp. alg1]|uniref:AAA family ATPase n=1 Tax=Falsirhodobacter sp. alg1 TaxID=1472418 RepID=UPI0005EEBE7A|nr:AAA family ATPase [Falsirhodobacter sp. alg1]